MASKKPENIEIRSYQVGFGDCFLLTFKYADGDRNVLIDFGSMRLPKSAKKNHMQKVAEQIKKDCKGSLDIVVATHRHSDHISGFATNKKGTAPGNIIASCKPRLVIQPWTENPRAKQGAKEAPMTAAQAFTSRLHNMEHVASAAAATARIARGVASEATVQRLDYIGRDNIKNRSAVENLMTMAKNNKGKNLYVNFGDKLPLSKILPGVKVHVLGPPSLKQSPEISAQRSTDENDFWHLQALAGIAAQGQRGILFPKEARRRTPIYARWLRYRLRRLRADMMLSIVTILDDQMNNTSVILLFEIGGKYLLFPGDAQFENWDYALKQKRVQSLLKKVTVYKVGHHGSLNATPKRMWRMFGRKGAAGKTNRLKSVMSTLENVHGCASRGTEVPRSKLVDALKAESDLTTTQSFAAAEISRVVRP